MSTSQLSLYNGALRIIGQTQLDTLTDNVEARYYLDGVWDNNAIKYCLEQGLWYFACRTSKFDSDPDLTPAFGYQYAFSKPADWVRTAMLCEDDHFQIPFTLVRDEAGFWFSDLTPLYVAYVSNDNSYGANMALWPESFTQYFQAYMAAEICHKLAPAEVQRVEQERTKKLKEARSYAAMNESATFLPVGSWIRARYGRNPFWIDRGNRNSLIG